MSTEMSHEPDNLSRSIQINSLLGHASNEATMNSNGSFAGDRDKGLQRAEDRRSSEGLLFTRLIELDASSTNEFVNRVAGTCNAFSRRSVERTPSIAAFLAASRRRR
ncbi:hypothetical protein DDK22_24410 [Cupriavidus necator]|uniref:Uncharacterized protein n=1 Tax=Cupriavidus necator TaxID=106590 RepID=A0A367PFR2_CUPNE|nr:hypothetical protein DDK22_24410 [Cupriavidus necator]